MQFQYSSFFAAYDLDMQSNTKTIEYGSLHHIQCIIQNAFLLER
jgi:hypothetical protein